LLKSSALGRLALPRGHAYYAFLIACQPFIFSRHALFLYRLARCFVRLFTTRCRSMEAHYRELVFFHKSFFDLFDPIVGFSLHQFGY
jgi:hypothetical protein